MEKFLKSLIKGITTKKALQKVLKKNGVRYEIKGEWKDIWVDNIRLYQPHNQKEFILQKWNTVQLEYSGTPTFFLK